MSDLTLGAQFIITGMVVVFLTLAVIFLAMWLTGRLVKEKKGKNEKEDFSDSELLAISSAIHHYRSETEGTALQFKTLTNWKREARNESMGRR